jgi:hypothetical protein
MRPRTIFLAALAAVSLTGCSPYRIDHLHLVFDDTPGLVVVERSTDAVDSEGKPLKRGRTGFPTKARLERAGYTLQFDIPASSTPMVFLAARSADGAVLAVEGAHLRHVHPDAVVLGYEYTFMVEEADGKPLEFVIRGPDGIELGREKLAYRIRSRGVAYGIDSI